MFCKKCGATLNDNALFCSKCGTKIGSENTGNGFNYSTDSRYQDNAAYDSYQGEQWNNPPPGDTAVLPKKKLGCGTYFTILQAIIFVIVFIWLKTDSGKIAINDIQAYIDGGETYVDMIKTSEVELLDMTYGTFINSFYDNCIWSYFKNENDERIVELNCRERTYGTPICIQFLITPIGNDFYYIEPCYISVDGYTLKDILSLLYWFM